MASNAEIAQDAFTRQSADMTMRVVLDAGPYRHLRIQRPDTRLHWLDIVTWPGALVFRGNYGTWVFARIPDMFEFFGTGRINPQYWAEKVKAGETRRYDEDVARQHVTEAIDGWLDGDDDNGLRAAVDRHILDEITLLSEDDFRTAVAVFRWWDPETEVLFTFGDSWEWDLRGFTIQFLWACHAIPWAIRRYQDTKTAEARHG